MNWKELVAILAVVAMLGLWLVDDSTEPAVEAIPSPSSSAADRLRPHGATKPVSPDIDVSSYSIGGVHLGGPVSDFPGLTDGTPNSPFGLLCGLCVICGPRRGGESDCEHGRKSEGTLLFEDGRVDAVFAPQLEIDGVVVLELGDRPNKIKEVLGPGYTEEESAGMTDLTWQIGGNASITVNVGVGLEDVYLIAIHPKKADRP